MFAKVKLFLAVYKIYFVLALFLVTIGGTGYLVWQYRSAMAEREVQKAVKDANKEAQKRIDEAEAQTKVYRELADKKYDLLMGKLSKLKVERVEITNNIRQEIADNAAFYNQPITAKGWAQWLKARKTYEDTTAPTK